jgi:hypothetical protein
VGDRIPQTVVAGHLEKREESRFHPDPEFYGYRPRGRRTTRSRHAANAAEVRLGFHLLRLPSGHAARNNKGQTFLAFPPAISKDL